MSERKKLNTKDMRKALTAIRADLDAALGAFTDQYEGGFSLRLGNCSYDSQARTFKFALTGSFDGAEEAKDQAERELYGQLVSILALPTHRWSPDGATVVPGQELPPIDTTLRINGAPVTIIGGIRKAKYNVIVRKADGTRTRYKAEDVARIWARQKNQAAIDSNQAALAERLKK